MQPSRSAAAWFKRSASCSAANPVIDRRNFTVQLTLPALTGNVVVSGRWQTTSGIGVNLCISASALQLYYGADLRETFPLTNPLVGTVKVTYWNNFISVWCDGRFIYSFVIPAADYSQNGPYLTITGTQNSVVTVYVPKASLRIDNYILDAGQKGQSLLDGLINQKRFWYQDTMDGDLHIFQARKDVNTVSTPYDLSVSDNSASMDVNLVTRLRLEGSDISENYDTELMINHGNLFHMENVNEINSPIDAAYYNDVMLQDYGSRVNSKDSIY